MRTTLSIAAVVAMIGLAVGATLANQPAATTLAQAEGFHQPSIMIDQITANAKDLPAQPFVAP
jgi:hypothetical protein